MLKEGLSAQPQWEKAGFTLPCQPAALPQRATKAKGKEIQGELLLPLFS